MARRPDTKSAYMPKERAAVELQEQFRVTAASLACGNAAMADDLQQEMSLAVLENQNAGENTKGFYANGAKWKARDARRREIVRGDEERKRRYVPGAVAGNVSERPAPGRCLRDRDHSGKRGRPRDGESVKIKATISIDPRALDALKRFARSTNQTYEMLLRGGLAMLAMQRGDDDMAAEFIQI